MQNHKFIIPETTAELYRIVCALEDNGLGYKVIESDTKGDSIELEPSTLFQTYSEIEPHITGKIEELYRDGGVEKIDFPKLSDGLMEFPGNIKVNPITGDWEGQGESGDLNAGLFKYGKYGRNDWINLSDALRRVISFGSLGKDTVNQYYTTKSGHSGYFFELQSTVIKVRFNSETADEDWDKFVASPTFPRSIPWREGKDCGLWMFAERYAKANNRKREECGLSFPLFELVMEDTKYSGKPCEFIRVSSLLNILDFLPGSGVYVVFDSGYACKIKTGVIENEMGVRHTIIPLKDPHNITPEVWKKSDEILQKNVITLFDILKNRGFLRMDNDNIRRYGLQEWIDLGVL